MTQGNAIDAGPRDWTLAFLGELAERAGAATPGPWDVLRRRTREGIASDDVWVVEPTAATRADLAYIAALGPNIGGPLAVYLRGEVERHRITLSQQCPGYHFCAVCHPGRTSAGSECDWLRGLASALGYPGDGADEEGGATDGHDPDCDSLQSPNEPGVTARYACDCSASQTGDSERGTPAAPDLAAALRKSLDAAKKPAAVTVERRMKISGPDTYGFYRTSCPCGWAGGPWSRRSKSAGEWERHECITDYAAPASPPVQSGGAR